MANFRKKMGSTREKKKQSDSILVGICLASHRHGLQSFGRHPPGSLRSLGRGFRRGQLMFK
eukprot:9555653-Lingulodinium_polyedra.AAC.1